MAILGNFSPKSSGHTAIECHVVCGTLSCGIWVVEDDMPLPYHVYYKQ